MEVKIWVLSGVVLALSGVLWWVVRLGIKGVYARLDKMIDQMKALGEALIKMDGEIANLKSKVNTNEKRLNDHAIRIRKLEINTAKKNGNED